MSSTYLQDFNRRHGTNIDLWNTVPHESWLRERGKTRILVIDDLYCNEAALFEGEPELKAEFGNCLNVEMDFFRMPEGDEPEAEAFTDEWFISELDRQLNRRSPPIAAIFLDLNFGFASRTSERAQGIRFLGILHRRAELKMLVPIIIMTTVDYVDAVEKIKDEGSIVDYIEKRPGRSLASDMLESTIRYGLIADPAITSYSLAMRQIAQQIRPIAIKQHLREYENCTAKYPRPVLLLGEIGSGKNHLASYLVNLSPRRGKLEKYTFHQSSTTEAKVELFGSGVFTDGPGKVWVDSETGAVLTPNLHSHPRAVTLSSLGAFSRADVSRIPVSALPDTASYRGREGALFLDELASASQECQQLLVHVFNHGSFRPHLSEHLIPTPAREDEKRKTRTLDVWMFFASPRDTYESVRKDLQDRLRDTHEIILPSLRDRSEDLMPLAVRFWIQAWKANEKRVGHDNVEMNSSTLLKEALTSPNEIFQPEAQNLIQDLIPRFGIRPLQSLISRLIESHYRIPYRSDELERAFSHQNISGMLKADSIREVGSSAQSMVASRPTLNANDIVDFLLQSPVARFSHIPNQPDPAATVRRAMSALGLGLLNKILEIFLGSEPGPEAEINVRDVVRKLSNKDYKYTNSYWDRLVEELLIHEEATVEAALICTPLRRLLESKQLAQRSKRIGELRARVDARMSQNESTLEDTFVDSMGKPQIH